MLDLQDALGGKVAALASRSYERDYWDTSVALERYTPEQLLGYARRLDPGLQAEDFADAGRRLDRTADEAFADLGLTDRDIATLRARFAEWPREAEARADREAAAAGPAAGEAAPARPELEYDAAIDHPEPEPEL